MAAIPDGLLQDDGTDGSQTRAEWDTAYINDLPDSAFAIVLPGGAKDDGGRTVPRSLRKLPHHATGGGLDLPHLRNALSREPQTEMSAEQHARARGHLQGHGNSLRAEADPPVVPDDAPDPGEEPPADPPVEPPVEPPADEPLPPPVEEPEAPVEAPAPDGAV